MWRWLHNLPRAVRQQCQGTGAAGVHVEDIHEKDSSTKSNEGACQWKTHCKHRSEWYGNGEKGSGPDKHDFWRMLHGSYSPIDALSLGGLVALGINLGQFKCLHWRFRKQEGDYRPCVLSKVLLHSMHTSAAALPRAGRVTVKTESYPCGVNSGGHRERKTHSRAAKGTSHVVQLRKPAAHCDVCISPAETPYQAQNGGQKTEDQTEQTDKAQEAKEEIIESLEDAFSNFEAICRKYTAVGKGIMGLQEAELGNLKAAIGLWMESGKLGHAKSNFNLAVCYEFGIGLKKDFGEAVRLYKLGAEELHPQSMYNLGVLYMEGNMYTPRDTKRGLNLISTAADFGLPEAQCYLGVHYSQEDSENPSKAVHYLTLAANQQYAEGEYMLGMCYEHGYGVEENLCRAAALYSKAAEKSHPEALYSLAVFHKQGLAGLPVDDACSERLMTQAAECGSQEAKEILQSEKTNQAISVINQAKDSLKLKVNSGKEIEKVIHPSVSFPCLTDLLREQMIQLNKDFHPFSDTGTVSQLYMQLMALQGSGVTSVPTDISKPTTSIEDSDSGVLFRLGSLEDEEEDFNGWEQQFQVSGPVISSSLQRNVTVPDMNILPCL